MATNAKATDGDRGRYLHAPPMLDDFFEELAAERMTSKAAIYREALMHFVRSENPDRARQIAEAWKLSRNHTRVAMGHVGRRAT